MDDCSRKFNFLSLPVDSTSRMELNFNDRSRKHSCSQPELKNINQCSVEFMGETNSAYCESDEAQQSSFGNEEEERSFEQGSNLSVQRPAEEFAQGCDEMVDSENGKNIDIMFHKYEQLGNELGRNLIALGGKNTEQKNQLSQYVRDYEFFIKQKEKNKKSLVELQIRMENLDTLKQQAKNECEIDKKQKSEKIGQLFQTLFSNDGYIKNTYHKFKDILISDKNKFNSLISEMKEEISNQKQSGDKYSEEMNHLYGQYESIINSANDEELNLDLKLDYMMQQLHICKGEKEAKENELKNLIQFLKELHYRVAEVKQKKELLQNELAKIINENVSLTEQYSSILDQMRNEAKKIVERYNNICESGKKLNQELNEKEMLVEEVTRKNKELIQLKENIEKEKLVLLNELSEKELQIHNLRVDIESVGNRQLIHSQINELLELDKDLLNKKLNIENTIQLQYKEQEQLKKLIEQNEVYLNDMSMKLSQEKQRKLQLETMHSETCKMLEQAKKELISGTSTEKLDNSEKHLKEIEDLFNEHKEKSLSLINEIKVLEYDYINVMHENDDTIKKDMDILQREKHLLLEREQQNRHLVSVENLKKDLEYLEELKKSKEAQLGVDEIKAELSKRISEHKFEEESYNIKLNSISESFNSQLENLDEQMKTLKSEHEEKVKKKISQNVRYRNAIPKIEEAVQISKNLLAEKIPSLIKCIDTRMDYLNNLIEVYKIASVECKISAGNNVDAKVVMNSIEKSLTSVMEHMMAMYEGPKLNASKNTDKYQQIFANVQKKYCSLLPDVNVLPTTQSVTKLTELAVCIYGGMGFPQKSSINESLLSSQLTLTSDETIF